MDVNFVIKLSYYISKDFIDIMFFLLCFSISNFTIDIMSYYILRFELRSIQF